MSASTTTAPTVSSPEASSGPEPSGTRNRKSLLRWLLGGTLVAAVLAAVTIAVWPESEADKARADGENVGQAVADLRDATSVAEANSALSDLRSAARDTRIHAGDAVAAQVNDQEEALTRAVDGFVGATTSDNDWDAELWEYELEVALTDLETQAENFRDEGPEVQQAFWDGFDSGLNGD